MTTTACEHFWELTPPSQGGAKAISVGVCKLCGESREFSNLEQTDRRPSWMQVKKKAKAKVRY